MSSASRSLIGIFLLAAVAGCSSQSALRQRRADLATSPGAKLTVEQALRIIRNVEQDPLSTGAPELRMRAFEWVVASDDVGDLPIDTRYLRQLEDSWYPFKGEMFMQYAFGMARWKVAGDSLTDDFHAQAEAGLRSVLTAYGNILSADAKLREPSLDVLERFRKDGRLREYIENVDRQGTGR